MNIYRIDQEALEAHPNGLQLAAQIVTLNAAGVLVLLEAVEDVELEIEITEESRTYKIDAGSWSLPEFVATFTEAKDRLTKEQRLYKPTLLVLKEQVATGLWVEVAR